MSLEREAPAASGPDDPQQGQDIGDAVGPTHRSAPIATPVRYAINLSPSQSPKPMTPSAAMAVQVLSSHEGGGMKDMADTMPPRRRRHYQRQPSAFARYVAPSVGLQPLAVEGAIYGRAPIAERFAALVRGARILKDAAMEARLMGPLRAVLAECDGQPLDASLIRTASAADLRDDQSRMAYLLCLAMKPADSRDELQRWLGDLDVTMGRMVELRAAIVGKLEASE